MKKRINKLNIAIFSPNENAYSETFIHAHKKFLDGNIFYYYGGYVPLFLENYGSLKQRCAMREFIRGISNCLRKNKKNSIDIEALKYSLQKNRIDVVLAEFGVTAAESLEAVKGLKIPLVVHFHGFDAHCNDIIKNYGNLYRKVFKYASKVVVVSRYMERAIIDLGCPVEKVIYAPYGPNKDFFEASPSFENQQFLAVGRFVDKKAPYYTILAFSEVLPDFPEAKLKMAADGPLFSMCKNLVKYLGIEKSVYFLGAVNHETVKNMMDQSLAFVQHSIVAENGDSEGTPVAVLEAGAAGLPVVATRHAGIVDVVLDEETGLLVDEHDVKGMTNAMKSILRDTLNAKKMGGKARERVSKQFSIEKHIAILEKTLNVAAHPNRT